MTSVDVFTSNHVKFSTSLNKCHANIHLAAGKTNVICLFLEACREKDNS